MSLSKTTSQTLTTPEVSTIKNGSATLTLPTSSDTIVGRNTTDTLTFKTLIAPKMTSIDNVGTLTLPTSSDTLVGRNTTDTFTNKTINASNNTITGLSSSDVGLSNVQNTKVNTSSSNPTTSSDSANGYSVGSRWTNTSTDTEYVCVDSRIGSAVWKATNLIVQDTGSNVTNTPHSAINFVGDSVSVSDGGNGVATVTVSGSNSTANSDSVTGSSTISTTSTSYTDIANMSLTLTTGSKVFACLQLPLRTDKTDRYLSVRITNSSGTVTYTASRRMMENDKEEAPFCLQKVITGLTPGSNTFKAQWKFEEGTMYSDVISNESTRDFSIITLN